MKKVFSFLLLVCLVGLMVLPFGLVYGTISVYNDESGFFVNVSNTVVTDESVYVYSGVLSTKIVTSGVGSFQHDYGANQNWDADSNIYFWWYGSLSNSSIWVTFFSDDNSRAYQDSFLDDFSGWRLIDLPKALFSQINGMDWEWVDKVYFGSLPSGYTFYLDLMYLDTPVAPTVVPSVSGWSEPVESSFSGDFLVLCVVLFFIVLSAVLMVINVGWLPRFVFGCLGLSVCAVALGTTLVLQPYVQLSGLMMSVLLMLVAAVKR